MSTVHVVVAVDGSPASVQALDRAAAEAVRRRVELVCLVVVRSEYDLDEAAPVLDLALARIRRRHVGLTLRAEHVVGDLVRVLPARQDGAALTVVGLSRHAAPPARAAVHRLARHATGPLMVVPAGPRPLGRGCDEVLFVPAGDEDADAAAFAFAEAARCGGSPLRVAHTWAYRGTPPGAPADGADAAPGAGGGVAARTRPVAVTCAPSAAELAEATRHAWVAVLAARAGGGRLRRALLRRAHCPVVFVPGAR
ncbi:hypothetical protein SRB5_47090 [Streptomyces sp. RB5]|uniref:UspA domain-containing protein n=1 Tax=Streptomyces smaragdinus TaxID=2585196 RepID=A0A7K0CM99_9ACTN|nr:universal stress protein [Streptomyces smaragdinus]MQY14541.1 hypothetical protein [Streptomyces smaragdinus]